MGGEGRSTRPWRRGIASHRSWWWCLGLLVSGWQAATPQAHQPCSRGATAMGRGPVQPAPAL
eukprot:10794206-Alexandrium_andersonii.AAC.1